MSASTVNDEPGNALSELFLFISIFQAFLLFGRFCKLPNSLFKQKLCHIYRFTDIFVTKMHCYEDFFFFFFRHPFIILYKTIDQYIPPAFSHPSKPRTDMTKYNRHVFSINPLSRVNTIVTISCRGRVVTNVVSTCDPTPLYYMQLNIIKLYMVQVT